MSGLSLLAALLCWLCCEAHKPALIRGYLGHLRSAAVTECPSKQPCTQSYITFRIRDKHLEDTFLEENARPKAVWLWNSDILLSGVPRASPSLYCGLRVAGKLSNLCQLGSEKSCRAFICIVLSVMTSLLLRDLPCPLLFCLLSLPLSILIEL